MRELPYTEFPEEHSYYRTSSPSYKQYLEEWDVTTIPVEWGKSFGWKKKIFGSWFQIVKFEKIDTEPDIKMLREKYGIKHAWLLWVPKKRADIPAWWNKLTYFLNGHYYKKQSIVLLDGPEYWKKWNERAKRARKKYKQMGVEIKLVDPFEFVEGFKATPTRHAFKKDYIKYYTHITKVNPKLIRSYVAYYDGKIVAGLAVHDYNDGKSSVHLVAYTNRRYYNTQAWTGLIDRWYEDSYKMGIKFIDFDRLREDKMAFDQKWYSEFKDNFIEFKFDYKHSYYKFI
jgi:hypothetical protein